MRWNKSGTTMNETNQAYESSGAYGEQWAKTMADAPEFNGGERADEREMLHEQEVIANADADFVEALSKALPQVGEDGRINYYVCGSMAMDLLPVVRSLESFHQEGRDGEPESQGIIELSDDARAEFLKGVRKKGKDFDVVSVPGRTVLAVQKQEVIDKCKNPDSLDILSSEKLKSGVIMFDAVGEDQGQGDYYYSKATMDDGEEIYIPSPGALIGAKAYEVAGLRAQRPRSLSAPQIHYYNLDTPEKIEEYNQKRAEKHRRNIEKRQKDLVAMIAGFSKVMSREQIIKAAETAIMHRLESDAKDYEEGNDGMPLEEGIRQLEKTISECFETAL